MISDWMDIVRICLSFWKLFVVLQEVEQSSSVCFAHHFAHEVVFAAGNLTDCMLLFTKEMHLWLFVSYLMICKVLCLCSSFCFRVFVCVWG